MLWKSESASIENRASCTTRQLNLAVSIGAARDRSPCAVEVSESTSSSSIVEAVKPNLVHVQCMQCPCGKN